MSVDISSGGKKESSSSATSASLYETKTLLCKNKCGYYGNSMQYDGYCSICFRKMKNAASRSQASAAAASTTNTTHMFSSPSFDDSTSLLASSFSFSNGADLQQQQQSIWNEQKNLSKFSTKKEAKNSGKSGIKSIFNKRSSTEQAQAANSSLPGVAGPKHSSSSLNLAETVSKVADKAVNLVDQSLFNLTHSSNSSSNLSDASALLEFSTCLNRLLSSPPPLTTGSSSDRGLFVGITNATSQKLNSSYCDNNTVLNEFESLFKANFPLLYADLSKQLRQFVEKFLEAFKIQQQQRSDKEKLQADNSKQSEVVQEFFKKMHKYVLTSASVKSHLERLNTVISVSRELFY